MASPSQAVNFADFLQTPPPHGSISLPPISSLFTQSNDDLNSPSFFNSHQDQATSNAVIDLTGDSSPPRYSREPPFDMAHYSSQKPARKRRRVMPENANETPEPGPSTNTSQSTSQHIPQDFIPIEDADGEDGVEQIDLTAVEDGADLRRAQEEQRSQQEAQKLRDLLQKESLNAQTDTNAPARLTTLSCIICMDEVTNLTATHCGHLFCHECLDQALRAGEKSHDHGKGAKCPVCRTSISRSQKPNSKNLPQIIPLEIKVRKKSDKAKGKERAPNALIT